MTEETKDTSSKAPKAPAPKAEDKTAAAVKGAIEKWTSNHLRNSPFSRDTTAWNHFHDGLPALIEDIVSAVKEG